MFLFGGMNNMAKTYMKLDGDLVPISVGTTPKEEQTKTVTEANFSNGNVVVTPDSGKVLTQVTVVKDNDLVPENIIKDVNIFGVVGTAETGGGASGGYSVTFEFYGGYRLGSEIHIKQANGNNFIMDAINIDGYNWGEQIVFENVTYIKVRGLPYNHYTHHYVGITQAEMIAGKTLTNDIGLSLYDD